MSRGSIFSLACVVLVKVLMLFVLAWLAGTASLAEGKQPLAHLQHLVVIEGWREDGWNFIGSGTAIDTDHGPAIMTAWHVLEGEQIVRVCSDLYQTDCTVSVDFFKSVAEGSDVAVALVVSHVAKPAKVAGGVHAGDEVMTTGLPRGALVLAAGQVVTPEVNGVFRIIGWCDYGSSGGGVFNKRGHLVGVISGFLQQGVPQEDLTLLGVIPVVVQVPVNTMCSVHSAQP